MLFFPVSVYDSYSTPSQWDYLTYHVEQTFSGTTINTDLPLLKVSQETTGAPSGNSALKLQTFMLSDIVSSTIYNLASSSLDSSLTATVFPTILSTGVLNLDNFLPLMDSLVGSMQDMNQLIELLSGKDLNDYVDGGIALNGFVPARLQGSYKYVSATAGTDNGGVLLIGTKYNPSTLRREVVGGGFSRLEDTAVYSDFSFAYNSLHAIDSTYEEVDADSVVVMLISSANGERQQGSALFLDALSLVSSDAEVPSDTIPPVVIDSCAAILNLALTAVDTISAAISWETTGAFAYCDAIYGPAGFNLPDGISVQTDMTELFLSDLQPDTEYELYVRCVCDSNLAGEWSYLAFHTDTLPTPTIPEDTASLSEFVSFEMTIVPNPANGNCRILFADELPSRAQLFAADGRLVLDFCPQNAEVHLKLPAPGLFVLKCETSQGVFQHKIINQ